MPIQYLHSRKLLLVLCVLVALSGAGCSSSARSTPTTTPPSEGLKETPRATSTTMTPSEGLKESPPPTPTTMPSSEGLKAINGTHLYYQTLGAGKPLFVLHGSSGSHRYFLPQLKPLAADYQLIFYDRRGTGLSDGQLDLKAISIDQFVEDLEALRRTFGFEKISLLGHSWGAEIALAYAFKYQAHLDKLILVDALPVTYQFQVELDQTINQRVARLSPEAQRMGNTTCQSFGSMLSAAARAECLKIDATLRFYNPAKALTMDTTVDKNTEKNGVTIQSLLNISFNRMQPDIDTHLKTLTVPTLIVHGDFDPIPVGSSDYLHHLIAKSQIVIMKESGHFPFVEQPERFVATIRAFLGK